MEEAYFPCYQLSGRLAALCCAAEAVVMAISAVVQDLQFGFFWQWLWWAEWAFFFFSSPVACLTWLFSDPLLSLVSAEQKLNLQLMEGRGPWCDTLSRRWCAEYSGSTLSFTSDPFCPWRPQEQLSMLMTTGSHFKIQVKHRGGKISRLRTEGFFFFLFFFLREICSRDVQGQFYLFSFIRAVIVPRGQLKIKWEIITLYCFSYLSRMDSTLLILWEFPLGNLGWR